MIDILNTGDPFVAAASDPVLQSILAWLAGQEQDRRTDYALYRDYYGGNHPTKLTDRMKKFVSTELKFADNFTEVVVDALAERLTVSTFHSEVDAVAEWAWQTWTANRMDQVQNIVHTDAVMLGDSYVLVDYDNEAGRPRFIHQVAETIIPHYNEQTQRIDWASKKWLETVELGGTPQTRLNLYYPGEIQKYVAKSGIWVRYRDAGDPDWPLPWVMKDGQPLGVPILHFRNKPTGGWFGRSEIVNVIPLQDVLNKHVIDLVLVNDGTAFRLPFTVNIDHGRTALDMMPGVMLDLKAEDDQNFEVGELLPGSPEGILKTIEVLVQHIAGISRTPQHLFQIMGGTPSGEALKTAEAGIVTKAKRRQTNFGNAWEDCLMMALKLQGAFGTAVSGAQPETHFSTVWDDPETRNQQTFLASLVSKQALGVPQEQLWREMGYNQEEIDQMKADIDDESVRSNNVGSRILQEFTSGRAP